ncbi:MAG: T9SS type A sorting domain-containing protein [Bacteroidota bacterium]
MMKKITLLFTIAVISATMAVAQSFTATYTFDSVKTTSGLIDPSAVPTAAGMTFGSFSSVGGTATNANAAERFSFIGWPIGGTNGVDTYVGQTGAISTTQYYEVTVTPASGSMATLNSISFKTQRSGTGIRTYAVRSNADSYAANLPASISPANADLSVQTGDVFFWNLDANNGGENGSMITLSGASFTNIMSARTFRFYGWNAEATGGTFSIDTVTFMGSVSAMTTSINNAVSVSAVTVYPNPSTDGMFTVDAENAVSSTVTVHNIIGKVVLTKEINGKEMIDLSAEANGSYFVTVKNDNGITTKKISINK